MHNWVRIIPGVTSEEESKARKIEVVVNVDDLDDKGWSGRGNEAGGWNLAR